MKTLVLMLALVISASTAHAQFGGGGGFGGQRGPGQGQRDDRDQRGDDQRDQRSGDQRDDQRGPGDQRGGPGQGGPGRDDSRPPQPPPPGPPPPPQPPQPQPPMPPPGQGGRDSLRPNDSLATGESLTSRSGQFQLVMQSDCNLVVYSRGRFGQMPIWSSKTDRRGANCRASFQTDSNFVVYTGWNQAVWSSKTQWRGADRLVMQDDGNLVLYAGPRAVWASK